MSLLAATALLANSVATQASPLSPAFILPTPKEAKKAIVACGIPASRVSVRFDRTLQEDLVWIARSKRTESDAQLECVATASLAIIYYVRFADAPTQARYDPVFWRLSDRQNVESARAWLRERDLLSTVPTPPKYGSVGAYARAVEKFCGVVEGSFLAPMGKDGVTFADGSLGKFTATGMVDGTATEAQFNCIMKATAAVDLKSHGIFFGFIGNAPKERPAKSKH